MEIQGDDLLGRQQRRGGLGGQGRKHQNGDGDRAAWGRMLLNKLRAHARSLAEQKGVVLMFKLTSDEKKALDWALNQNFGSVAARYSKILATALKILC